VSVIAGAFEEVQPLTPPPESWASKAEAELAVWQFVSEPAAAWTLPPTAQRETVRTIYVFGGSVEIGGRLLNAPSGAVIRSYVPVVVTAGADGAEALILQARPIGEPVAMGGPFVMNTHAEIDEAYRDFRSTGFGGWPWSKSDPVHPRSTPRFARHPSGKAEYPVNVER
jgi:redox-sensitive bicupin YhaK (pirin superfamily)